MTNSRKFNIKSFPPKGLNLSSIIKGDMPGDKIKIDDSHILRANKIFPYIINKVETAGNSKTVISIFGGSGVGKSEIGSLIAHYFKLQGYGAYVLSGDNYPKRIPIENDKERLKRYTESGKEGLEKYLGTDEEINFTELNEIILNFKKNAPYIRLKRMGRTPESISYESVDFRNIDVLVIEWTHGNNQRLRGVDYPVFLFSTPQETLKHRLSRGRDSGVDSPFTQMVLKVEQELLNTQTKSALIINKNGEIINKMLDGVMLNAYPDSCGGALNGLIQMLQKDEFKDSFSSLYILPSMFKSDLDRGFSIISYDLDTNFATNSDLKTLKQMDISLKLDFVLNHLSVGSPQFKDLLKNGDNSKYIDTFIDWNKFWKGCGTVSPEGYIIPNEEYLSKLFMRKPGLPILKIPFPDGSYRFYWNTFYQKITLKLPTTEELMKIKGIDSQSVDSILDIIKDGNIHNIPTMEMNFDIKYKDQLVRYLDTNCTTYLGQMDLNGESESVWNFYEETFQKLSNYGAKIVRLDAFAYMHKEISYSNFFNEPGTWEYLDRIKIIADRFNLTLLPEIHGKYEERLHEKLSNKGYAIYDFFFPGLVIHAIEKAENKYLINWIKEIVKNGYKTVNMLGSHDGIPLIDVKGLLDDSTIDDLISIVKSRGGRVKDLFGANGKKISYYQINSTFFSALGENEKKLLLARAIQIFMPGIPDIWYLDLFEGTNDYAAADAIGHKDINRTNLSNKEIEEKLQSPTVIEQLSLIKLRNTHPAFLQGSKLTIEDSQNNIISLKWENGDKKATLTANLLTYDYVINTL